MAPTNRAHPSAAEQVRGFARQQAEQPFTRPSGNGANGKGTKNFTGFGVNVNVSSNGGGPGTGGAAEPRPAGAAARTSSSESPSSTPRRTCAPTATTCARS